MNNIDNLTTFFGWCSVINIAVLLFSTLLIIVLKEPVSKIHVKLFGLEQSRVSEAYFRYLGHYKIAILMFNVAPYIALKMMT